ncbi:MAG: ferritin-like domain-containing protein [Candidatus Thorarchaeota archaeon]
MISKALMDLLNQAVARELQVSIQYMLQHSKMEKILRKIKAENLLLDKTTYDAIGEELKKFAIEEMKHAGTITERIYYLGGSATTKAAGPTIGNSLKEFAKLGHKAEEEALELYRKIIDLAMKEGDWETVQIFEKIYSDEERHFFKFEEYLSLDDSEPDGPEAFPTEFRKIYTDSYFALLNKAVAAEISAIIQYTNQHEKASLLSMRKKDTALETITDTNKAQVVSDILKTTFLKEMEHLERISERIYLLEGECVYNPDPLPKVGDSVDEFLKLDHKAEDDAIILYRKIIAEALKLGDTATRKIFEEIVVEEEEHYWTFDDFF